LGHRARTYEPQQPKPGIGTLRHVMLSQIIATDCSAVGCSITGLPDHPVEDVTLADISLGFEGGGTREDAVREIPERPDSYPESTMFGTLPSYGLFCRHVKGLRLRNVHLQTAAPDHRHAVRLDDVENAVVDALEAPFASESAALLRLSDCRTIAIRNCRPPEGTSVFLSLAGRKTSTISLYGNDFTGAGTVCDPGPEVAASALALWSNHGGKP
jgi:hypothetical protein